MAPRRRPTRGGDLEILFSAPEDLIKSHTYIRVTEVDDPDAVDPLADYSFAKEQNRRVGVPGRHITHYSPRHLEKLVWQEAFICREAQGQNAA